MRIIGGIWKGRILKVPKRGVTRPTQDRVREALISQILAACSLSLDHCSVLDAFAGTGAVGLELLSRGAKAAYFAEKNVASWQALTSNIRSLHAEHAYPYRGSALSLAKDFQGEPFDIVYLDPPYADDPQASYAVLDELFVRDKVQEGTIVVHQRDVHAQKLIHSCLELCREKRYASSCVAFYKVRM